MTFQALHLMVKIFISRRAIFKLNSGVVNEHFSNSTICFLAMSSPRAAVFEKIILVVNTRKFSQTNVDANQYKPLACKHKSHEGALAAKKKQFGVAQVTEL